MKNSTAIILILVSIGLFYTFTDSQYQVIKGLRAEAGEYKGILKNAAAIAETRDVLYRQAQSMPQDNIDRLEKLLPDNVDAVRLAYELDTIAGKHKVTIKEIEITSSRNDHLDYIVYEDSEAPYVKATVNFSLISTYENLKGFLADVERSLRLIDVRELSFKVEEGNLYEHKISIETYWLK
jgi:Tfp pilus assembly protein PilO